MLDYKGLKDLLKESEGFHPEQYDDGKGNPTLGYGFNLNNADSLESVNRINKNTESITPDMADAVLEDITVKKKKQLDTILKDRAPSYQPSFNEEQALTSLMYHAPKLVGPNLLNQLNNNNKEAAAREILVNSNRDENPGFAKRRIDEARKFLGEDAFKDFTTKLPMEDIAKVKSILQNMNETERANVLKENPWLEYRPESAPLLQRLKMRFNK